MNTGIVAVRYAKALLGFAQDKGVDGDVYACMKILAHCYTQLPTLALAVSNAMLPSAQRRDVLLQASACLPHQTRTEVREVLSRFFDLVLAQHREDLMRSIALQYVTCYREANHVIHGVLTTATEVDEATVGRVKKWIEKRENKTLELDLQEDPSLIGGFSLEVNMNVIDLSVAAQLRHIRKVFGIT